MPAVKFAIPLLVIVVCWIVYRQRSRTRSSRMVQAPDLKTAARQLPDSPLVTIPFSKAVDSAELAEALPQYALRRLSYDFGLDCANIVVQSVSIAKERDSITVAYEFSKRGVRLLRSKSAVIPLEKRSGRLLPTLQDAKTKRFLETAKGRPIDPSHFAKLSSIVVSAAHIISAMDVVRRLDALDRKLDVLLQGRRIDQRAELEKIYQMSRERLTTSRTEADRQEMLRWRGELYKLRSSWRQELHELLASAPDPDEWRVIHVSTWRLGSRERKTREHLIDAAAKLRLAKLALIVDLCLAYETETLEAFVGMTAPDESALWEDVSTKASRLVGKMETEHLVDVEAIAETVRAYRETLSSLTFPKTEDAQLN